MLFYVPLQASTLVHVLPAGCRLLLLLPLL
jgi:hypothetical protein